MGTPATQPSAPRRVLPRRIFTFWHDERPPPLVCCCIALMRRRHPDWKVILLHSEMEGMPPPPVDLEHCAPQMKADWYRLAVLARHGGVWLDASTVTLRSVEDWVDSASGALQGFVFPGDGETMETWAFAAPREHPLLLAWRDEFGKALSMGFDARGLPGPYCEMVGCEMPEGLRKSLPYLALHAAWRRARASLETAPELRLASAVAKGAPLHHLAEAGWDSRGALAALFAADAGALADTPLLKLRSVERKNLPPLSALAQRGSWLAATLTAALVAESIITTETSST